MLVICKRAQDFERILKTTEAYTEVIIRFQEMFKYFKDVITINQKQKVRRKRFKKSNFVTFVWIVFFLGRRILSTCMNQVEAMFVYVYENLNYFAGFEN